MPQDSTAEVLIITDRLRVQKPTLRIITANPVITQKYSTGNNRKSWGSDASTNIKWFIQNGLI